MVNVSDGGLPPARQQSSGAVAGFIVMLVLGVILTMIGLSLLIAGIAASVVNSCQGTDGYFTTEPRMISTSTFALASPHASGFTDRARPSELPFEVADVRLTVKSTTGSDIFIGIASQSDVNWFFRNVPHTEVTLGERFLLGHRDVTGSEAPGLPADRHFWVESASGPGWQQVTWSVQPGNWAVVVMNSDASRDVSVQVAAGVRSDLLAPVSWGLVVGGIACLAAGVLLIVFGALGLGRRVPPAGGGPAVSATPVAPPPAATAPVTGADQNRSSPPSSGAPLDDQSYPVQLTGELDSGLSRWLWLVKWLLAIPHYIVLFGLWIVFVITTIVAGFAILFTGRYPRPLFNFNVGVLRWSWRVGFYAYSALGTDRYPPFTLSRTDYPAQFDVEYPSRLSRGLVLVKWWLLAIPHYLVISVFTGSAGGWWVGWWPGSNPGFRAAGFSLIGLLVLIAAVILLFTNRYRRGLFDFLIGLNRWVYRVIAYASLMRDDYPPFRLDLGPTDPGVRKLVSPIPM